MNYAIEEDIVIYPNNMESIVAYVSEKFLSISQFTNGMDVVGSM